jgi:hypothetical protein
MKVLLTFLFALFCSWTRAADADTSPAELLREYSKSLVFVEDKEGAGSGFVATIAGKQFVITNQHVVAGHGSATFTLLDRSPLKVGAAAAAVGHDIMTFATQPDAKAMDIMLDVEKNAAIGDDIVVLGNPEGARVIKPLAGKLVGIGPNLVEVSAEFVPGNSGSPILHLKSGKVIGIATYVIVREMDSLTGRRAPQLRRFGYRLDSVKQWQPVAWPAYNDEFSTIAKIQARTQDLAALLTDMARSNRIIAARHTNPAIKVPLEKFEETVSRSAISANDRARAAQDLMAAMRNACQSDIEQAKQRLRYDFFQRQLGEEQQARGQFHKIFDEILKAQRK